MNRPRAMPCSLAVIVLSACGGSSGGSGAAWTWVSGSSAPNAAGVYGTRGSAAATNVPGARLSSATWTDSSGNLWLFGGIGNDSAREAGELNDLWKYSPASGQWTWVNGSSTVNAVAVYGTQGVDAASNVPGARSGSVSWTDTSGNLWLFGGIYHDGAHKTLSLFNDLWKYSTTSGQWTWVSGSSAGNTTGVYGTQGAAAAANVPGGRLFGLSWRDDSGNFWLFGGLGYDSTGSVGKLNDLWRYSISSGQWTWVSGASTKNAKGVYGVRGVAAATNVPGARRNLAGFKDARGDFWLFGGLGYDSAGGDGELNDLWRYSISSGQWTWVSGASSMNAKGVYGNRGVAAATNVPGARGEFTGWTDARGNFWLFGGDGCDDLWKYSTSSGQWTWVGGSKATGAAGIYGVKGVAAARNEPGARFDPVSWADASGKLWLFGGFGSYDTGSPAMNDLWMYPTP